MNAALPHRMPFVCGLVAIAMILTACGGGPAEPPSSAEELLERVRYTMANVETFAYSGKVVSDRLQDGQRIVLTNTIEGWRGQGDTYAVRESYSEVADPPRPNEQQVGNTLEWVAEGGMVLSRSTRGDNRWREFAFSLSGRPPSSPNIDILDNFSITGWTDDATLSGVPVYVITGTHPYGSGGQTSTVELTMTHDTYELWRTLTTVDLSVVGGDAARQKSHINTYDYRLTGFGQVVSITMPDDFEPAQFATYTFEFDGEFDRAAVGEMVNERLHALGASGIMGPVWSEKMTIRLFGETLSPERVQAILVPLGKAELFVRHCLTSDCEGLGEFEDHPTGVGSADITKASATRQPTNGDSPIGLGLTEDGVGILNVLLRDQPTSAQQRLVLFVDGVELLVGPFEVGAHSPHLRLTGDFLNGQEVNDWAAIIGDGPLHVRFTLVDYIPPRGPHHVPTPMPGPTPTPLR